MADNVVTDEQTGRKYFLDVSREEPTHGYTFLLNLHGGGSVGQWQREYFPAYEVKDDFGLIIATPSCATKVPFRFWVPEADDAYLRNIVSSVFDTYHGKIRAFWLVGHSQGGMTSNRLLQDPFFNSRVDGWLSLSGGRIGPIELPESFFAPFGNRRPRLPKLNSNGPEPGRAVMPPTDVSFIFATGEHEMVSLPDTSPWAEKLGCGPRERLPDIVDSEPGKIYDTIRDGNSSKGWGLRPRPGTAEVYLYPNAAGGQVIADVVRLDKGHTEGLEPKVTRGLVELLVSAPGGRALN